MSKKEELHDVVLVSGEGIDQMRLHIAITEEANNRAIELMDQEEGTISDNRRTKLYFQAMKETSKENREK
jgi:hypothetical protein